MNANKMLFIPVLFLLSSCVAPGSALTRVSVSGQILSTNDAPVAQETIEVGLPAGYGLTGLDARRGKPEMYGHRTQRQTVTTNNDGVFSVDFKPVTYSVSVWLLPPLGAFPRRPPPPLIWVKIPSKPGELYAVFETEDGVTYRIFDVQTKEAIPHSNEGLFTINGSIVQADRDSIKGSKMELKIKYK